MHFIKKLFKKISVKWAIMFCSFIYFFGSVALTSVLYQDAMPRYFVVDKLLNVREIEDITKCTP